MKKRAIIRADPAEIFLHAHRFNQAYKTLIPIAGQAQPGDETLGQPAVVVSALSCELFLKCLSCIENGVVPRGHHLRVLYEGLSSKTQARILELWNTTVVPLRALSWKSLDPNKTGPSHLLSDFKAALDIGSLAFEKIRYSYEGNLRGFAFILTDLPIVLSHVAIELKPEFAGLHPRNQARPAYPE